MDEPKINERLARIEANQQHQEQLLEKLVDLFERMLRVEMRTKHLVGTVDNMQKTIEDNQVELTRWRHLRVVLLWVAGLAGTAAISILIDWVTK